MKEVITRLKALLFYNKSSIIEKKIKYRFIDKNLLKIALTHPSYKKSDFNYQRLEFLGDAILDHVISNYLFNKFPNDNEGKLTQKRASLVNSKHLGKLGINLNLIKYARFDSCIDIRDKKVITNISSDIYEAIIGAISLDSNYINAKKVIENTLLNDKIFLCSEINYKGNLIEYCHSKNYKLSEFNTIKYTGPAHKRTYYISVDVNGTTFNGNGSSKKIAEQRAAKDALDKLT